MMILDDTRAFKRLASSNKKSVGKSVATVLSFWRNLEDTRYLFLLKEDERGNTEKVNIQDFLQVSLGSYTDLILNYQNFFS